VHKASASTTEALNWQAKAYAESIISYIEAQFQSSLEQESKVRRDRTTMVDTRVHACLYLINPDIVLASRGLTEMDRIVLGMISTRVNVIPCLAKSDLVTVRDLRTIREYLKSDLHVNNIRLYRFEVDEDDEVDMNQVAPFCLVNSEQLDEGSEGSLPLMGVQQNGEVILGREYIWGVVETQNPAHCDFLALKNALLGCICRLM
jgi:septin family protein